MKFTSSLFTQKIVEEELEDIQKALVISHGYYVSQGKYDDALKITKVIYENLDKDGCFVLTAKNKIVNKYILLYAYFFFLITYHMLLSMLQNINHPH